MVAGELLHRCRCQAKIRTDRVGIIAGQHAQRGHRLLVRPNPTQCLRAIALETAGYPTLAHDELAKLFNDEDMLPRPDQDAVRIEEAARIRAERAKDSTRNAPALLTGVVAGTDRPRPNARSWAP